MPIWNGRMFHPFQRELVLSLLGSTVLTNPKVKEGSVLNIEKSYLLSAFVTEYYKLVVTNSTHLLQILGLQVHHQKHPPNCFLQGFPPLCVDSCPFQFVLIHFLFWIVWLMSFHVLSSTLLILI